MNIYNLFDAEICMSGLLACGLGPMVAIAASCVADRDYGTRP